MSQNSPKFKLDIADFVTVGKTALLVGGAAALTYIAQNLGAIDLGTYGPLIVPVVTLVLDTVVKWLRDNSKKKD